MNFSKFTRNIAKFNNVLTVDSYDTEEFMIVIHFEEIKWKNTLIPSLQYFDKIVHDKSNSTRPFIKALKMLYRTDCLTTVFLSSHNTDYLQQTILMGKERLLIPKENGKDVHLIILPFFSTHSKEPFMHIDSNSDLFQYKGHYVFFDPYQIPYPGGSYYDHSNNDKGDYKRMCVLTQNIKDFFDNVLFNDLCPKSRCFKSWMYTRSTTLNLPDLFNIQNPTEDFYFQEKHLRYTELITKTFSTNKPEFLLQDILNTYHRNTYDSTENSFPLKHVALFVEHPITLSFGLQDNSNKQHCSLSSELRYTPFFINSLNPKTILQVTYPYDRYYVYEGIKLQNLDPKNYTMFYYIPNHKRYLPDDLERVIINNVIVGYEYKKGFLCLNYPMLLDAPEKDDIYGIYDKNYGKKIQNCYNFNTQCLLNSFENFDPKKDKRLEILGEFNYNEYYNIYKVKHVGKQHETWCLVRISQTFENFESCSLDPGQVVGGKRKDLSERPFPKYFRKAPPPMTSFVAAWVEFFMENVSKKHIDYGNLNVFKLAFILARHKICFEMQLSDTRKIELLYNKYNFCMDQPAIDFINNMRILTNTETVEDAEKEERSCVIA